jgi:hypothetical protein
VARVDYTGITITDLAYIGVRSRVKLEVILLWIDFTSLDKIYV